MPFVEQVDREEDAQLAALDALEGGLSMVRGDGGVGELRRPIQRRWRAIPETCYAGGT